MSETCHAKVAVLLAVYNGEDYLGQQIDSLLHQTFKDIMIYIHDDGSKDHSKEVENLYAKRYPDRVKVLDGPSTGGAKTNFLYLMKEVEAEYYMYCDQDDFWKPEKIEKTWAKMQEIEEAGKPALVCTDLAVADETLHVVNARMSQYQQLDMKRTSFHEIMVMNIVTGCTVMINRVCRDLTLKCNDLSKMIMHDWWAALAAAYFGKVGVVDEPLILYRQHGDNSVGAKNVNSSAYALNLLKHSGSLKNSLKLTEDQAACFLETFGIQDEAAEAFAHLEEYPKWKRVQILQKYHLWKSGIKRNIGLLFSC
jgi:glycosyltransferase involved in cell wall biosynthesis